MLGSKARELLRRSGRTSFSVPVDRAAARVLELLPGGVKTHLGRAADRGPIEGYRARWTAKEWTELAERVERAEGDGGRGLTERARALAAWDGTRASKWAEREETWKTFAPDRVDREKRELARTLDEEERTLRAAAEMMRDQWLRSARTDAENAVIDGRAFSVRLAERLERERFAARAKEDAQVAARAERATSPPTKEEMSRYDLLDKQDVARMLLDRFKETHVLLSRTHQRRARLVGDAAVQFALASLLPHSDDPLWAVDPEWIETTVSDDALNFHDPDWTARRPLLSVKTALGFACLRDQILFAENASSEPFPTV